MNNYNTFIGIDAHKKYCFVNVQNDKGEILEKTRVETDAESLQAFFSKFDGQSQAVLESTYNWIFVYETIKAYVGEVKLANPKQTKAISAAKVKTDKVDAGTLASLLRADLIPEIYVSTEEERSQKDILRYRFTLVKMRTSLKNKIHAFMARYGFAQPFSDMFGLAGTKYIKNLPFREPLKEIVFKYLGLIESLGKEIDKIDSVLGQTIKETKEMRLLQTIPGIGKVTSYLISTETGPIERFPSDKNFVSYSGLVPAVDSSGGKTYYKRSKERNKYLQWAFIEAAIPATRSSPILLAKYTRIKKRKGSSKAKMTVARRIAEAVYKVLTYGQEYQEGVTIRKSAPSASHSLIVDSCH